MWADSEADIDLLGFDFLVDSLYVAVTEPRLLPLTIGLLGDWGSGKSSLMAIARRELEQFRRGDASESPYLCVSFSPWQYEDYDDVKVALMTTILDAIGDRIADDAPEQDKVFVLRRWARGFGRWGRRIGRGGLAVVPTAAPLIAQGLDPTMDPAVLDMIKASASATATEGAKLLQDPKPADSAPTSRDTEPITDAGQFRTEFEGLVEDLADVEAIVVFIDDLDRCLPETVVDTFESIRLFVNTSKTAYVIAANQAVVESAIDSRYPELVRDGVGLGANYLEKMLQLKVTIPQLSAPEADTYMNLLLAELHLTEEQFSKVVAQTRLRRASGNLQVAFNLGVCADVLDNKVPDELVRDLNWAAGVAEVLGSGLRGNPRQLKRFLNNLMLKHRSADRRGIDLKLPVLAKLMALEEQYITEFRRLFDWQLAAAGAIPKLRLAEKAASASPAPEGPASDGARHTGSAQARRVSSSAKQKAGNVGAGNGKTAEPPELPDDVRAWTEKPHIRAWLQLPPELGDTDLRPYFTYSRDKLTLGVAVTRLPQHLQELLAKVQTDIEGMRLSACDSIAALPEGERLELLEALLDTLGRHPAGPAFIAVLDSSIALRTP
ncbi:MAG TPA: P-loop NTPase fold protein [Amycolatopsis sp.]|uniref:KAP family P-loop NTPase fold protein n=1 Tax=Amycolatopsis sp. TaxID=37632 RepID=UPI002B472943|nr:P-loop NTPase fold protein [Amycolatopsis sp.]HKS47112.1 P-loop NTPase fold protein [Amycolatopsis sp.]